LEGESEGGSVEVEERHLMARTTALAADVAFVVGTPGIKGSHSLVRVIQDLVAAGVPPSHIVPVLNRAPKAARARAEHAAAIAALLGEMRVRPTVAVPERRVDDALRDGVRLPRELVTPLVLAYDDALADASAIPDAATVRPQRVQPGSLGTWSDDDLATG
jgi:hypothetical protein